jgi:hypothetical protein
VAFDSFIGQLDTFANWFPAKGPAQWLGAHLTEGEREDQTLFLGKMGVCCNKLLVGDDVVVERSEGVQKSRVSLIHQVLIPMLELELEGAVRWQVDVYEAALAGVTSLRTPVGG